MTKSPPNRTAVERYCCRVGLCCCVAAAFPARSLLFLLPLVVWAHVLSGGRTVMAGSDAFVMQCYACSGTHDDGCSTYAADMDKLQRYIVNCTKGTHECFKIITPQTHAVQRSCGIDPTMDGFDMPLKDGCVDIPHLGYVCSCSTRSLCNAATSLYGRRRHSDLTITGSIVIFKPFFTFLSHHAHDLINVSWIISFFLLGAAFNLIL
ncbi:uncharacterized protein LOC129594068 [Paramacrobiotus metropolitanus]|uniref:uncharacterized protein LOC129594068 n=1 Tax=Paramacrobiotus metropolitanus TaxID=2943436 RepID=UPI0024462E46|nr:uncharacterized protein LOC129594068 [Paramacrobiotus metropolitanus]